MKFVSFLALIALTAYADGNDEEEINVRLLISKHVLNKYLFEDMNVVVKFCTTVIFGKMLKKIKIWVLY
jgi:hypothetical protein